MAIVDAEYDDLEGIYSLLLRFHEKSGLLQISENVVKQNCIDAFINLIDNGLLLISKQDSNILGAIGVISYPYWLNNSVRLSEEMFWYSENGTGIDLLLTAMAEAKVKGSSFFICSTSDVNAEKTKRFLLRSGFFQKENKFYYKL